MLFGDFVIFTENSLIYTENQSTFQTVITKLLFAYYQILYQGLVSSY